MGSRQEVFGVTVDGDITGLKKVMNEAVQEFNSTERAIKKLDSALKLDPKNIELLKKRQEEYTIAIQRGEDALQKLKNKKAELDDEATKKGTIGTTEYNEKYIELETKIVQLTNRLSTLKKELREMPTPNAQAFISVLEKAEKKLGSLSKTLDEYSKTMGRLFSKSIIQSTNYESDIANIKKIVNDLTDETIDELKRIAVQTGTAFTTVAEYAAFSGALGLAEKDIANFTKTMIDLNVATGGAFGGEEGAKSVVVFMKNVGASIDEVENFASAITYIGDKFADIGDETLQLSTQMASLATISGVDQYGLIGLAGVMKDLGLRTSVSANAITKAFLSIEMSIAEGGDKLKTFAEVSGMTTKEFKQNWGKDALNTFTKFLDGLGSARYYTKEMERVSELLSSDMEIAANQEALESYLGTLSKTKSETKSAAQILDELEMTGARQAETLLKLAGNGRKVRDSINETENAWTENTALMNKTNVIYETTKKRYDGVVESLKQAGASLSEGLLPYAKIATDQIKKLADNFANLDDVSKSLILAFIALSAGASKGFMIFGNIARVLKDVTIISSKYKNQVTTLTKVLTGAGKAGLVGAAALAAGALTYLAGKQLQDKYSTGFYQLIDSTQKLNDELRTNIELADKNYRESSSALAIYKAQAEQIDDLVLSLKDENLEDDKRAEINEKIQNLISSVNQALGEEAFYFENATGKLYSQGEEIDNVSSKYDELAKKVRRELWLDAHKEIVTEAYQNIETAQNKITEATRKYLEATHDVNKDILQIVKDNHGNWDEILKVLNENDLSEYEELAGALTSQYALFSQAVLDSQKLIDDSQKAIDGYIKVSSSTNEGLDAALDEADMAISKLTTRTELISDKIENMEEVEKELRDIFGLEEGETNSTLEHVEKIIKADKERKGLLGELLIQLQDQHTEAIEINAELEKEIHKKVYIDIVGNTDTSYLTNVPREIRTGPYSGGFGNSGGFGSTVNEIESALRNQRVFNSGGYSRNIRMNTTINVNNNGNTMSVNTIRDISNQILNMVDEGLGSRF